VTNDNKVLIMDLGIMPLHLYRRPRNDILCVEWDVKLYTLTHSLLHVYHVVLCHFFNLLLDLPECVIVTR